MSNLHKCAVSKCTRGQSGHVHSLHGLPKDPVLREKWISFLLLASDKREVSISPATRICSAHFEPHSFQNWTKKQMGFANMLILSPTAVPTIFVEGQLQSCSSRELITELAGATQRFDAACQYESKTRDVGCRTDPPLRRNVGTQVADRNLKSRRSQGCLVKPETTTTCVATDGINSTGPFFRKLCAFTTPPSKRSRLDNDLSVDDTFNASPSEDHSYYSNTGTDSVSHIQPLRSLQEESPQYVVQEDCLLEIFRQCPVCSRLCELRTFERGTFLSISQKCHSCLFSRQWRNQLPAGTAPNRSLNLTAYFTESSFIHMNKGTTTDLPPNYTIKISEKWEWLGMDVKGPFPETQNGNCYLLTVLDYYTKWIEACPIKSDSAEEVALTIRNLICQFGTPLKILSQMDKEFIEDVNDALSICLAAEYCSLVVFHPATYSLDTCTQSYINSMVSDLLAYHQDDWDVQVPASLFSLRCREHPTTRLTPFYMMYGRTPHRSTRNLPVGEEYFTQTSFEIQDPNTDSDQMPASSGQCEVGSTSSQDQTDLEEVLVVQCDQCLQWDRISQAVKESLPPTEGGGYSYRCAGCRDEEEGRGVKQEEAGTSHTPHTLTVKVKDEPLSD